MVTRRLAAAAVVGVLTAGFVALPGLHGLADQEAVVEMELFGFSPASLSITTGTTVVWVNAETLDYPVADGTHRVVADDGSFDSGDVQPTQRFSRRFLEPGTVAYHCSIHPLVMKGTLSITGPKITPKPTERTVTITEPSSDASTWGFKPAELLVPARTTITWRNNGANEHSVTADDGSFNSGLLPPGATFERTFTRATSVRYHCTPHPWMTGVIRVGGAAPLPPPPKQPTPKATPVVVEQPSRAGNAPATFSIVAVEPDPAAPLDWGWRPSSLSIRARDSVVWRNGGTQIHTVTADDGSFESGSLAPGATFRLSFERPATIRFHCTPHPWMKGVILVAPAAAGSLPPPPAPDPFASPSSAPSPAAQPSTVPTVRADQAADVRAPLAIGSGALVLLVGAAVVLLGVLDRRRYDAPHAADRARDGTDLPRQARDRVRRGDGRARGGHDAGDGEHPAGRVPARRGDDVAGRDAGVVRRGARR